MGEVCSKLCAFLTGDEPRPPPQAGQAVQLSPMTGAPRAVYAAQAVPIAHGVPMATGVPVAQYAPAPYAAQGTQYAPAPYGPYGAQGMAMPAGMYVAQGVPVAHSAQVVQGGPAAQGMAQGNRPVQVRAQLPGRRRSLLIGINYFGSSSELNGCIADVRRMVPLLASQGFPSDGQNQLVLLDEPGWPAHQRPTASNMRQAISWLTKGAQTGDALFFHYSGHGGREESSEGADGFVETLCPVDYDSAGQILDTELFESLVRPLPSGCRLTCLMDCCHSGGVLNLPYLFTGTEANLKQAMAGQAAQMAMSKNWMKNISEMQDGNPAALLTDVASMGLGLWSMYGQYKASKNANSTGFVTDESQNIGVAVGEVIAITGCRSDQTSADVGDVHGQFNVNSFTGPGSFNRRSAGTSAGGALTAVFIECLQNQAAGSFSYLSLLEQIRRRLAQEEFEQVPQLATSLLIELQQPFSLDTISLPADPNNAGQKSIGGGAVPPGARGAPNGSAGILSGFMASMAMAPQGKTMLGNARGMDGSTPYAGFMQQFSDVNYGDLVGAFMSTSFASEDSAGRSFEQERSVSQSMVGPESFASHATSSASEVCGEQSFQERSFVESSRSSSAEDEDDLSDAFA